MNAKEFKEVTLGKHTLPDGRGVSFWVMNTEQAIQMAMWPLLLAKGEDKIKPSPEELEVRYQNLLEEAQRLIIARSCEPKFVKGEPKNDTELSISIFKPEEDDEALIGYYTEILNQSGISRKRIVESAGEKNGNEALAMACAAFSRDPTEVLDWDNERSAKLLMMYDHLVDARNKAHQAKRGNRRQ